LNIYNQYGGSVHYSQAITFEVPMASEEERTDLGTPGEVDMQTEVSIASVIITS
jgi:hypothetical protein